MGPNFGLQQMNMMGGGFGQNNNMGNNQMMGGMQQMNGMNGQQHNMMGAPSGFGMQ